MRVSSQMQSPVGDMSGAAPPGDLWSHGLICAYEFSSRGDRWVPIGWNRIGELVHESVGSDSHLLDSVDDGGDFTAAAGPVWWCHMMGGRKAVESWLTTADWMPPKTRSALRDATILISEEMSHLLYEVPVREEGGLLFELLGEPVGNPSLDEKDGAPSVLRLFQAQNFLITTLHSKGPPLRGNVVGIEDVQTILSIGGHQSPKTVHEIVGLLASGVTQSYDRGKEDDLNSGTIILDREIRKLSTQISSSLRARQNVISALGNHLRGPVTRELLKEIKRSTEVTMQTQEQAQSRLHALQSLITMQRALQTKLQERSPRVLCNFSEIGSVDVILGLIGCLFGLIVCLFGINLDKIPAAHNAPYVFGLFAVVFSVVGILLLALRFQYVGMKPPIPEEQLEVRRLEPHAATELFRHESESRTRDPFRRSY